MFKKDNQIWFFFIGIVIMFGVLFTLTTEVLVPIIIESKSIEDILSTESIDKPEFLLSTTTDYLAKVNTNLGEFVIDLFETKAPQNVNNFVYLSNLGYYNGTKVHRIIPDLLFQMGDRNTLDDDPLNDGKGYTGYFIEDEINWDSLSLSESQKKELTSQGYQSSIGISSAPLEKFSVAMASSGPNTNSSQFFIVTAHENDPRIEQMNGKFTVIGKIVAGGSTINRINSIAVDNTDPQKPIPLQEVVIKSVEIFTK
jgi:cyclophilin family peptidyl-prolyl cis-trans isomerase